MSILSFSLGVFVTSVMAGLLGALTGLGGGVVLIPVLCLPFKIDLHFALGASLVSAIATSPGTSAVYVGKGYAKIRTGMFLEVGTTPQPAPKC
jgi:uncharacterized membrane protein YfcA